MTSPRLTPDEQAEPDRPEPNKNDLTLSEDDRRELIGWAASCIRRLLPVFVEHCPSDERLQRALESADEFRAGRLAVGPMREHARSCHAAARDCQDQAAQAVARACGHAAAIAHMGGHARNIERYTRKALAGAALVVELEWQRTAIPARLREYVFGG